MKILLGSAAALALLSAPVAAHAQTFGGLDNGTLLGGTAGAGLGAVLGSQLAGSGARTEGSAIGAVAGGLLGASIANQRSNYYGNPYAGQFNPGFNGRNLVGAGIGAGLGGALGSKLAGSGNRQEGTAIGAALGGLAGYAAANRSQRGRYGAQAGFGAAPGGFGGVYAPGYGAGYGPAYGGGFGPGYAAPGFGVPAYGAPAFAGPSYINSGQFISGPVIPVTTYSQPAQVISRPAPQPIYIQAPAPRVVQRTIRVERMPIARAETNIEPAAPCPTGTTPQADGSCMERTVRYTPAPKPVITPIYEPAPSYSYSADNGISAGAPVIAAPAPMEMAPCPAGTTTQADGSCMERAVSYQPAPIPAPVYAPAPMPAPSYAPAPTMREMAPCPARAMQQSDGSCMQTGSSYAAPGPRYTLPDTVAVPQAEYCYPDSAKRYDSMGREIISGGKHGSHYNGQKMVPCTH